MRGQLILGIVFIGRQRESRAVWVCIPCGSCLIDAVIAEVGPGTQVSDFATYRELTSRSVPDDRHSSDSFWKIHAPQEVPKARVRAQSIEPKVSM